MAEDLLEIFSLEPRIDLADLPANPWVALQKLPKPIDMTEAYDKAIELFKRETRTERRLTHDQFRAYFRDKWDWKADWEAQNTVYKFSGTRTERD